MVQMSRLLLLFLQLSSVVSLNFILPTVFWDPINPLFACEQTINVQMNDILPFQCSNKNRPYNRLLNSDNGPFYETAYLVDEEMYNACNSTNAKKTLLQCHVDDEKTFEMNFRSGAPSPGALKFKEGHTYYVIGTSFRTVENVDNKINGSCNTEVIADNAIPEYKLRLKIYVCTTEELESGECEICSNTACYMKGCDKNCSDWATDYSKIYKNSNNECFSPQSRTCVNELLGTTEENYRETNVSCPPINNCTMWAADLSKILWTKSGPSNCSVIEERLCTLTGTELRLSNVTCPINDPLPVDNCTSWVADHNNVYANGPRNCSVIEERVCTLSGKDIRLVPVGCPVTEPTDSCAEWMNIVSKHFANGSMTCAQIDLHACSLRDVKQIVDFQPCHVEPLGVNCTTWTRRDNEIYKSTLNNTCFELHSRQCNDSGVLRKEAKLVNVSCAEIASSGVPRVGENDDASTYKYVAVGATIACFLIGLILGFIVHKKYHDRSCSNKVSDPEYPRGFVNNGYTGADPLNSGFNLKKMPNE